MTLDRKLLFSLLMIAALFLSNFTGCSKLNNYQKEGTLFVSGLTTPVTVLRDEKGMAYIYGDNINDVILAQGFVTAQDRLFQMELTRLFATGRISELAGEKAKSIDIRHRTLGFHRIAKRHAKILNNDYRMMLQKYADGVNEYIKTRKDTHPLEFKLAGIKPGPWTIEDSLAIMYFMGWSSSANLKDEIIAQRLVEKFGFEKARSIFPLNINPDDREPPEFPKSSDAGHLEGPREQVKLNFICDKSNQSFIADRPLEIGSNNWTVSPTSSPNGKPVVANDPHLYASMLPGPWYPTGLITPDMRAIGVMIPGIPGMIIGRTDYIAIGVTNAYGDTQDLYVESLDPDTPNRYMEGDTSLPFEMIEETLLIKDKEAPEGFKKEKLTIRLTRRGPVVSNILPDLKTDKTITLRWSLAETMTPSLGINAILKGKSVKDVRNAMKDITFTMLNFVFADTEGNIGWQTSGRLPIRFDGNGILPHVVNSDQDNWQGWIPFDEMPQAYNPDKGWLGTCNHMVVKKDFPYYYSSHLSPSYRYRRLKQLLDPPGIKTADDHWRFQRDTKNLFAAQMTPIIVKALSSHDELKEMVQILSQWDFKDDPDQAAPSIFQGILREFARLVYGDELGDDLNMAMLDNWYFWQERLGSMVVKGSSPWFDDISTGDKTEEMGDLFYQAAVTVRDHFTSTLGKDPHQWQWGKIHQMEFVSPVRREGFGKGLLGGGSHPAPGSAEVLYRGLYKFSDPFNVTVPASLRMVADLGDEEKVLAVLPGGVSSRMFNPHYKDQIKPYMNGDKLYWWFSDAAIKAHAETTLVLESKTK